jgi:hypothetical protein
LGNGEARDLLFRHCEKQIPRRFVPRDDRPDQ